MALAYLTHTVKSGESLSAIAYKYKNYKGVSVSGIMHYNNLKSSTIQPGMRLKIYYYSSSGPVQGPSPTGPITGGNLGGGGAADFGPMTDKIIGGVLLYGIFRVLMKVF